MSSMSTAGQFQLDFAVQEQQFVLDGRSVEFPEGLRTAEFTRYVTSFSRVSLFRKLHGSCYCSLKRMNGLWLAILFVVPELHWSRHLCWGFRQSE